MYLPGMLCWIGFLLSVYSSVISLCIDVFQSQLSRISLLNIILIVLKIIFIINFDCLTLK